MTQEEITENWKSTYVAIMSKSQKIRKAYQEIFGEIPDDNLASQLLKTVEKYNSYGSGWTKHGQEVAEYHQTQISQP